MITNFKSAFLGAVICLLCYSAAAQHAVKDIVQITGVTMTADSLRAVPNVIITVKNQDRGVLSNPYGIFALVCRKGDTLHFSSVGYRSKDYVISKNIEGNYFNMVQLMVQDTFYLPETIIKPIPYGPEFDYAFKYWDIQDDQYATAQKNMDKNTIARLRATLPMSGRENQAYYQNQQIQNAYYYGQIKPFGILNPFKWNEFFQAWKRGDFRKKY